MNAWSAPWHKESFDRLLRESLPALLAQRLPLAAWHAEPEGEFTFRATLALGAAGGETTLVYEGLPQPNAEGVFRVGDRLVVVEPLLSDTRLDVAEVKCVGEQLLEFIEQRLGKAPAEMQWTDDMVRALCPLDQWLAQFLSGVEDFTVERHDDQEQFWFPASARRDHVNELETTNALARAAHLRRLRASKPAAEVLRNVDFRTFQRAGIFPASQVGRTCPFETPEGSDVGRVLHLARGATIRAGKVVIIDDAPAAALGLTAGCVPFLECSDANRLTMAVNAMRQWLPPPDPEPAIVRTGLEPQEWCGRNLLTAFISWGVDTYEDGLVVSESAARRLGYPQPLDAGDKLSNRHGQKGVVTRILPDEQMPHLADGTPVDLICDFIGLQARLNYGQVREAVMGRIAKASGRPVIVPPFAAPKDDELRKLLADARLPESGMELLRGGRNGPPLARPSTTGWVYWGKTFHTATPKMSVSTTPAMPPWAMRQAAAEYAALRDVGAFANVLSTFNTASADHRDASTLAQRAAAGPVSAAAPTPAFERLTRRLAAAGVRAEIKGGEVRFAFADAPEPALRLAQGVAHPWWPDRSIDRVGCVEDVPAFTRLKEADARLRRMLSGAVPAHVAQSARDQAVKALEACLDALVAPGLLQLDNRVLFSGRAVICPEELALDQVALPDEMAWELFGPLVARETGDAQAVAARTPEAARALDAIMARSWVIIHRAPTLSPTAFVAFHPARRAGSVVRIHPLVTPWMNADFDGDQVGVFLPLTDEAQREAGERLSVRGHLRRDPALIRWMAPHQDILWALADRCRSPEGRREVEEIVGRPIAAPGGVPTRESFREALRRIIDADGVDRAMSVADQLARRGFDLARKSGASMHPMLGSAVQRPKRDREHMTEFIESFGDFDNPALGPQILSVRTGARGNVQQLLMLLGGPNVADYEGRIVPMPGALCDGRTPEQTFLMACGARAGLAATAKDVMTGTYEFARIQYGWSPAGVRGHGVLARAMRSRRPGLVFAHAAATGEVDPLADIDARLFAGLRPPAE